ncbi:ATP-binding protein [Rhodococcus sp. Eu-32]|uniref:ATP-binding protein n=1 Tax=Rhodococcus sp. Eu-32 TaxID=1017319 RepID=UPI001FB44FB8|nr:ATP-binding protein [Rhodococcus sp. Eu-32]
MTDTAMDEPGLDPDRWTHTSPAVPDAATTLRRRVRKWATGLKVADSVVDAIELASYEALANVVEHAYARSESNGGMTLTATHESHVLTVTVSDTGTWQPPTPTPDRSHGLALIEAVSDNLDVDNTDDGTVVTIVWSLSEPASS